jgi:hypothetical protein
MLGAWSPFSPRSDQPVGQVRGWWNPSEAVTSREERCEAVALRPILEPRAARSIR